MDWTPAILHRPRGSRVQCLLCPMRCLLADGETGPCRVRRRSGEILETATFATSVRHLDAVERKPLYHFRPGTHTLTLAAPGCTFRCDYCVNHRMSQYGREEDLPWTATPADPREIVAAAAAEGASVALSYTEPSLAVELTLALADEGGRAGVPVVWKSNGFLTPEAVRLVAPRLAAVNIDVKAVEERAHHRLTGAPLAPVLRTLRAFAAAGVWVEVSTPLIPGVMSEPGQLAALAGLLAEIDPGMPWHLLRFTPDFRMREEAPTTPAALAEAVAIGRAAGLRHVYVERALGPGGRETRCPACDAVVVRRGIWSLESLALYDGRCEYCGHPIPGRW
ncbi:pyruvate formate lyase activating enzyme [Thermocatellispora tengchongensis]|uniref:Pyruvate formate lyase activating enzyme n=1 Tax=Thermocatellispora tengchongensis TaxID=1073253 RepID=A0A840P5Z2_9ACTN|nr:AmmeMemoRadiSam system radical SAM enzyme [Thermocatellispora tengchongensis]MBB5134409.1 pyruvate formate lyase activating enzyme [Thermocatellispora tengchongensis]